MDQQVRDLRVLIRSKLVDSSLPMDSFPNSWGGLGKGETCNACDEAISGGQFVMEGPLGDGRAHLAFHVQCFHLWDDERQGLR